MAFKLSIVFTIFVVVCAANTANSANILGYFSTPSRSHYIVHESLMKGLAAKGHNVTVVTAFPTDKSKKLPPNYHELTLKINGTERRQMDEMISKQLKDQSENHDNRFRYAVTFLRMMGRRSHQSLQNEVTQQLLKSGQKFDLLVLGWFFNDFQLGLAGHFQCPSVVIASLPPIKALRDFVANPSGIPVTPFMGRAPNEVPTFLQRALNVFAFTLEHIGTEIMNYFMHAPYYEMNFPSAENYPSFDEVKRNVSLVLVNDHFSEGTIRANMPNMKEIAGIQTKSVPNPLPKSLQTFLDEADEHGAIFFSLGTNVKSSEFSAEKLSALFEVFAKLKQRIIWKWDGAVVPPEKSENILMSSWLPQNDILAHRNVRLFISHCGLGGVIEAKFHGVPILAMPIFGDQPKNAEAIVNEGWALELRYSDMNATTLSAAIDELITNKTYANKVKELSRIYRDRPHTALEEAVFWTEYILRHNGARHMQSPAVQLNFIQRNSLDILAAFIIFVYVFIKLLKWVIVKSFLCIARAITRRRGQSKIKTN